MTLVRFKVDTFHPRKRSLNPDYEAGKIYDLPEQDARFYIERGNAERAFVRFKVNKPTTIPPNVFGNKLPADPRNVVFAKNNNVLAKAMGVDPNPNPYANKIPVKDPAIVKMVENKQLARDVRQFFNDKDVPVKELAGLLANLLDYGVDIRDWYLVSRVAGDINTIKRITDYYYGKPDGK